MPAGQNSVQSSLLSSLQLAEVVPSVAEVLLAHGAEVNKVAKGQSPLSLAIINGHDSVSVLWYT